MDAPRMLDGAFCAVSDVNELGTRTGGLAFRNGVSARALMAMEFPPIKYVVPGFIPEGATLLAGAPKQGKSWMVLGLGIAVASGGLAFGSVSCEQGDVLYLALEDNPRRLKSRLSQMQMADLPDRLTLMTEWPDLDGDCVPELENWIHAVPNPTLIIIDVLARIRGRKSSKEPIYEQDYRSIAALQSLAGRRGVAIIIVHHTRKNAVDDGDPFDEISGSRGLAGAADTALVLRRDRGTGKPLLYGRGRDLRDVDTAMEFDQQSGFWRIVGAAHEVALTADQLAIIQLLGRSVDPMTPSEIVDGLGKERTNIQHQLTKLVGLGKVTKPERGSYALSLPHSL